MKKIILTLLVSIFFVLGAMTQDTIPCVADYTYNTTNVSLEVEFYDNSIGNPDQWTWDFGDGNSSTLQNPVHLYGQSGTYQVCLTIATNDTSCNDMICYSVLVSNDTTITNCENYFTYNTNDSLTYNFNGYMVDSLNSLSVDYTWDFGDGSTANGQYVTHTYLQGGVNMYTCCLTTYLIELSGDTCVYTSCQDIYIGNPGGGGCVADFYYNTTSTPLEIEFFDNSTGNPDQWTWDFGDGNSSTIQSPVHTFSASGTYYVCLTIFSNDSNNYCNDTQCYNVTVIDSTSNSYTGIVYLQNQVTADAGIVRLMEFDSMSSGVINVATTTINGSDGSYTFDPVSPGSYYIQAELDNNSAYYMQYLPTYHLSSLYWTSAQIVWPNGGASYDVFMIASDSNSYYGPGQISGSINQITDDYVEDMEVLLLDAYNNPLTYTRTDQYGQFSFNDLEYGSYYLHIEFPGITCDQIELTLDANNPSQNVSIFIENGNAFVGIIEEEVMISGELYPNPVVENVRLKLESKTSQIISITIINQLGQLMKTTLKSLHQGVNTLEINSKELPAGMYYLQILGDNGERMNKILMKK